MGIEARVSHKQLGSDDEIQLIDGSSHSQDVVRMKFTVILDFPQSNQVAEMHGEGDGGVRMKAVGGRFPKDVKEQSVGSFHQAKPKVEDKIWKLIGCRRRHCGR